VRADERATDQAVRDDGGERLLGPRLEREPSMNAGGRAATAARRGYRNLVGLVVVSLLIGAAFVPLVTTLFLGTPLAVLGGLWTTCLLLGVATIVAFHFATIVTRRGVPVPVLPSVTAGIRRPVTGLALGAVTFVVVVTGVALVGLSPDGYRPYAVGLCGFVLVAWTLLVAFAAPDFGDGRGLRPALAASASRLARSPDRVAWFLALSAACAVVAGLTVVTLVLFLPGVVALLAAHAAVDGEVEDSESGDDGSGDRDSNRT